MTESTRHVGEMWGKGTHTGKEGVSLMVPSVRGEVVPMLPEAHLKYAVIIVSSVGFMSREHVGKGECEEHMLLKRNEQRGRLTASFYPFTNGKNGVCRFTSITELPAPFVNKLSR